MKNTNQTIAIVYMICSVLHYISSAVLLFSGKSILGFVFLGLGATFMCLSIVYSQQNNQNNTDDNTNEEEHDESNSNK
ncbi:MAG: hypothetical protein ACI4II_09165 [Acutalibacteraceae bacterium]